MKRRAWGCAANIAGGNGTSAKLGGERSQRAQRRAVRLRCSAWPQNPHPAVEKVVGGLGTAVGAGTLHWWGRISMFPPPRALQSAPPEAAARVRVIRARSVTLRPPTTKNFFLYGKTTGAYALFFGFTHIFAMVCRIFLPRVEIRMVGTAKQFRK